jgi:hypothetical protein
VCAYLVMLDKKLPELQTVMAKYKFEMTEILIGVEAELGAVVAELGSGTEFPEGPYVKARSGLGVALENNQSLASLVGRIHQQVRNIDVSVNQASQKANQASGDVAGVRSQVVQVAKHDQRDGEVLNVEQMGGQLMQLTQFLAHVQQEVQQCNNTTTGGLLHSSAPPAVSLEVNGIPVEDAVAHLKLEVQVVQSRLLSESASIGWQVFESYEDTLKWVVTNCSPEDWQYVMDM